MIKLSIGAVCLLLFTGLQVLPSVIDLQKGSFPERQVRKKKPRCVVKSVLKGTPTGMDGQKLNPHINL